MWRRGLWRELWMRRVFRRSLLRGFPAEDGREYFLEARRLCEGRCLLPGEAQLLGGPGKRWGLLEGRLFELWLLEGKLLLRRSAGERQ